MTPRAAGLELNPAKAMRTAQTAFASRARPDRFVWQVSAARSAGKVLAPESLELDLFLFLACAKLAAFEAVTCN